MTPLLAGTVRTSAALAADREALEFEAELQPIIDDALRLAAGILLSKSDAEDAVQESCLRAWRSRGNRRSGTDLRPWFLAIVANQCREIRRGHWWRLGGAGVQIEQIAEPQLWGGALELREALGKLRYRVRLAIVLRYYLDLPFEGVAAAVGCSVDAAKALVRRGTAELARELGLAEQ